MHTPSPAAAGTGTGQRNKPEKKSDDTLLATARERFRQASEFSSENRANYVEDTEFSSSDDQWTAQVKQLRGPGRPALTFNRLNGVIKQIVGDYRQNKLAIKVRPASGEASEEVADILAGVIRNIESASSADVAYATALECACRGGFGWFRVLSEYAGDDAFEQDLVIRPIHNPLTVYCDPAARLITRADAEWMFVTEVIPTDTYERLHPDEEPADFEGGGDGYSQDWLSQDGVRLAEYYEKQRYAARLAAFSNGMVLEIKDDAEVYALEQMGVRLVREREAERVKVVWRRINGYRVLEEREYRTKYIPLIPVIGEEVNVEGKVLTRSAIFYAKDGQRMHNYGMTAAIESLALQPKAPWLVTPEHIQGVQDQWDRANTAPSPYLVYNHDPSQPVPQRINPPSAAAGEIMTAMQMADEIKATTGIYDASLGARSNETSGRAIVARQQEGATATFIFIDNLKQAIEHCGRVLIDLIPSVYDTERMVRVLDLEGNPRTEVVNEEHYDALSGVTTVLNSLTVGKYDVVVDVGPSFANRRAEAVAAITQLAQAYPPVMQLAGDLVVASMDFPGAEKIAQRLKRSIPPQIAVDPDSPEGQAMAAQAADQPPQVPPEVQAQQAQAERQQQEFAAKMELENRKFAFDQAKAERQFELEEKQMLADAALQERKMQADQAMNERQMAVDQALKERQMQLASDTDLQKHAAKTAADREHSIRMSEAAAKPAATIQLNAEDAFGMVAETMKGLAEQQANATEGLLAVAETVRDGAQAQTAALGEALAKNASALEDAAGKNAAALEAVMKQNAAAVREVATAVTQQAAATERQTEVMKLPRVAVRDKQGNIVASKIEEGE